MCVFALYEISKYRTFEIRSHDWMKINSTEKILFVRIQTVFIALFNYIYIYIIYS